MKVQPFNLIIVITLFGFLAGTLQAKTFTVSQNEEADFATIQEAVDTADNGDQIFVLPGEYDPVTLKDKVVHLISRDGPEATIIHGRDRQPVIYVNSENRDHSVVVRGFTLTKGAYDFDIREGGAISGRVRSIIIENNFIVENCGGIASGIDLSGPNIEIVNNYIAENHYCSGEVGGGSAGAISLCCGPNILIAHNLIEKNTHRFGAGGGIHLDSRGIIHSNIIRFNTVGLEGFIQGEGGGIHISGDSIIEQNLIYGNFAKEFGGGISMSTAADESPEIYYNTIVDNVSAKGSQIYVYGLYHQAQFANNIISDPSTNATLIHCEHRTFNGFETLQAEVNLLHSEKGGLISGDCDLPVGANISRVPNFVDPDEHDYSLKSSSIARDRGHLERDHLLDINGSPRRCGERQDLGALEYCEPHELFVTFKRGDSDGNGALEVTDPIVNLTFQFLGEFSPPCMKALDFDDSGEINISDPIASLTHKFLGGLPAAAPGSDICGIDLTEDDLTCLVYSSCE